MPGAADRVPILGYLASVNTLTRPIPGVPRRKLVSPESGYPWMGNLPLSILCRGGGLITGSGHFGDPPKINLQAFPAGKVGEITSIALADSQIMGAGWIEGDSHAARVLEQDGMLSVGISLRMFEFSIGVIPRVSWRPWKTPVVYRNIANWSIANIQIHLDKPGDFGNCALWRAHSTVEVPTASGSLADVE